MRLNTSWLDGTKAAGDTCSHGPIDHVIDAITKLFVRLLTALLHRRLAQLPPEPPAPMTPAKLARKRRGKLR